jgi:hypothetical protein
LAEIETAFRRKLLALAIELLLHAPSDDDFQMKALEPTRAGELVGKFGCDARLDAPFQLLKTAGGALQGALAAVLKKAML